MSDAFEEARSADDEEDGDEPDCMDCGGDGWVHGSEIADFYDYGWIDENKTYRCPNCGGSGLRKDQTTF